MIVDIINFDNIFNLTLYFSVFCSSSRSVYISFLDSFLLPTLATDMIHSSAFSFTATSVTLESLSYIGDPVKLPYNSSIIIFCSKIHYNLLFSVFNGLSNDPFYYLDQYITSLKKLNRVFLTFFTSWSNPI